MADFFWNQASDSWQAVWDKFIESTKQHWGTDKALKESDKIKKYSRKELKAINEQGDVILAGFARLRYSLPDTPQAQALVEQWRAHISQHFYECTVPLLEGLGQNYSTQEMLQRDIDRHGMGTAAFMSQAIAVYCEREYEKFEKDASHFAPAEGQTPEIAPEAPAQPAAEAAEAKPEEAAEPKPEA